MTEKKVETTRKRVEMSKTIRLLDLIGHDTIAGTTGFGFPDEDVAGQPFVGMLSVRTIDWEDMGSPGRITVTIEPGDTLNKTTTRRTAKKAASKPAKKAAAKKTTK